MVCSYVFYTHPRPATHWLVLNGALIVLYTMVMIAGAAAAVRGIILDAQARSTGSVAVYVMSDCKTLSFCL